MLNACELCERIAIEREKEKERNNRENVVKQIQKNTIDFIENVISPAIDEAKEERIEIKADLNYNWDFREDSDLDCYSLLKGFTGWKNGYTSSGYKKKERKPIWDKDNSIDLIFLKNYMANYGYNVEMGWAKTNHLIADYESSKAFNSYLVVDRIVISIACPVEKILKQGVDKSQLL